jgi:hypothetical protein
MTRIIIEVDSSGNVTTSSHPKSATEAALGAPSTGSGASYGDVNAGSAPSLSPGSAPMHSSQSNSVTAMDKESGISAGPAPASIFQSSNGGGA